MADFLHIFINPKPGVTRDHVEQKLDGGLDWIRYYDKVYVVYTSSTVDMWQERLRELVKPEGSLFICKLDVSVRQGWMTEEFWDWLNREKKDG